VIKGASHRILVNATSAPNPMDKPQTKSDLPRMQAIAVALLVAAGLLYLGASAMGERHPAWGYAAAFGEAAMVGAIADWFAVVALFRRPFGLPIPHTAVIPSNKNRIGENLANFICANFLGTPQVLEKVRGFGAGMRLAGWLASPHHAAQVATQAGAALRYVLDALDDRRVQRFFGQAVLARLHDLDGARLASRLLDVLATRGHHQALLDAVLRKLAVVLDDDAVKARLADVVASEVQYLRLVGLDRVAARFATAKLVSGVVRLVGEMADDPQHALRKDFDAFVVDLVERLAHEPALRERAAQVQRELLATPALARQLRSVWSELVAWARSDLDRPDSQLRERCAEAVRGLGETLRTEAPMRAWIEEQLLAAAPQWIDRYREDIRRYIAARVSEWNADEMTRELERNIGRDLQFIRINGTLVGGAAGLVIHALTQLARAL
jgi:uncharacterized membrane-anchored protein YjiN (DUF445 family)